MFRVPLPGARRFARSAEFSARPTHTPPKECRPKFRKSRSENSRQRISWRWIGWGAAGRERERERERERDARARRGRHGIRDESVVPPGPRGYKRGGTLNLCLLSRRVAREAGAYWGGSTAKAKALPPRGATRLRGRQRGGRVADEHRGRKPGRSGGELGAG